MAAASTTPTSFSWPTGPTSVQVSGDWNNWTERVDLEKQSDGSFSGKIPLPSETKVHYKFIVDGHWTTSSSSPVVNDSGNQNNVVDVGPAPTMAEQATTKAAEVGGGIAAGVTGAAAAAAGAAHHFTEQINGTGNKVDSSEPIKPLSPAEKKEDPASSLKTAADEDIRNHVPTSITTASHAALPVLASAVATVTGADILRGDSEALPVTQKEINDTQAEAMKGDNSYLASKLEPQGGAVTNPAAATTENAQAASSVAKAATGGAAVVPVTNNGFAANVTGTTGNLTTAADIGKVGGEKADAVATASAGTLGAAVASGAAPAAAAATPGKGKETALPATTTKDSSQLPSVGTASNKTQADKANAPAAASSGPLATGKETTTPAAAPAITGEKSLPTTPANKTISSSKTDTIKGRGTTKGNAELKAAAAKGSESSSAPATPERKKKTGLLSKIKHAISPHTSPAK